MCGRFTQTYTWSELHGIFQFVPATPRNLEPRYNISPTQQVGVVTLDGGHYAYSEMRWWLVPNWWKKALKDVPSTFNARAETVDEKPMFRSAFRRTRCLIPASGFFEWTGPKDERQPWYISAKDGMPLIFAGLHDTWRDPESGDDVKSCTIIVTSANRFMGEIHDRMPVILQESQWRLWLDEPRKDLLNPADENLLHAWRVSSNVNSSRYHGDDTTKEIEHAEAKTPRSLSRP